MILRWGSCSFNNEILFDDQIYTYHFLDLGDSFFFFFASYFYNIKKLIQKNFIFFIINCFSTRLSTLLCSKKFFSFSFYFIHITIPNILSFSFGKRQEFWKKNPRKKFLWDFEKIFLVHSIDSVNTHERVKFIFIWAKDLFVKQKDLSYGNIKFSKSRFIRWI